MSTIVEAETAGVIIRAVATELKVAEADVRAARSFKGDLKMDSISAVNVAFMLEEHYDVELQMEDDDSFDSVEAIVKVVCRALRARVAKG